MVLGFTESCAAKLRTEGISVPGFKQTGKDLASIRIAHLLIKRSLVAVINDNHGARPPFGVQSVLTVLCMLIQFIQSCSNLSRGERAR